jgi:hypothetical protein
MNPEFETRSLSLWTIRIVIESSFNAGKRASLKEVQDWTLGREKAREDLLRLNRHIPFSELTGYLQGKLDALNG